MPKYLQKAVKYLRKKEETISGNPRKYYKAANRQAFYKHNLKLQKGLCAICGKRGRLVIDHDHKTGLMRSLLCFKHNTALGFFGDDPDLLRKAAAYIEFHKEYKTVYDINTDICIALLKDLSFPTDKARAKILAAKSGCSEMAAQTRISRARKRLMREGQNLAVNEVTPQDVAVVVSLEN